MPTPDLSTWVALVGLIAIKQLPYIIAVLLLLILAAVILVRLLRGKKGGDDRSDRFDIKGSMDRGDD